MELSLVKDLQSGAGGSSLTGQWGDGLSTPTPTPPRRLHLASS